MSAGAPTPSTRRPSSQSRTFGRRSQRASGSRRRTDVQHHAQPRPSPKRCRLVRWHAGAVPSAARPRLVFLDIDGTYAHRGVVPAGHEKAVRDARAAGHRVLLCTGRSRATLPHGILDVGFDGMVASADCYVELEGEVLADRRFPEDLANKVVDVLDEYDAAYTLEAPEAVCGRPGVDERLRQLFGMPPAPSAGTGHRGAASILAALEMREDLSDCAFAKLTYRDARVPSRTILDAIGRVWASSQARSRSSATWRARSTSPGCTRLSGWRASWMRSGRAPRTWSRSATA